MDDRLGWIAAAGVALIAGIAWNGGIGITIGDDEAREVAQEVHAEREIAKPDSGGDARIVIRDSAQVPDERQIAAATAAVVRAEVRLAKLDITDEKNPEILTQARAERDRAEAELDRLADAYEAAHKGADRHRIRDEVRTKVREALR